MTNDQNDSQDDVWELLEFLASEAFALRSFVEYLRTSPDSQQKKNLRIQNWRTEIGIVLGNPIVGEHGPELLRKARGLPAQMRSELLRQSLAEAREKYFGKSRS